MFGGWLVVPPSSGGEFVPANQIRSSASLAQKLDAPFIQHTVLIEIGGGNGVGIGILKIPGPYLVDKIRSTADVACPKFTFRKHIINFGKTKNRVIRTPTQGAVCIVRYGYLDQPDTGIFFPFGHFGRKLTDRIVLFTGTYLRKTGHLVNKNQRLAIVFFATQNLLPRWGHMIPKDKHPFISATSLIRVILFSQIGVFKFSKGRT